MTAQPIIQDPQSITTPRRDTPSFLAVNLYLLIGLIVLIVSSFGSQTGRVRYLVGIAVEFALALGTLIFQRFEKLSMRDTLRLRWPSWQSAGLSVALALGLWMIGVMINLVTMFVLGYTAPISPSMFPRDALDALLLAFSTVVVAPVCEEVMFRGYVQRAYERRSPWTGILVSGVIFALYHLRFQGAFALVPVAMALGFVAWRSNSLLPGILLHAAYNSIATVILIASSFLPLEIVGGLTVALICAGLLLTPVVFLAVWWLWRVSDPPSRATPAPWSGLKKWLWPLPIVVMLGIYGYAAVTEIIIGRFPRVLAVDRLALQAPSMEDLPIRWRYDIQAGLNETIGDVECALSSQSVDVALTCELHQEAYETDLPIDLPIDLDELSLPGVTLSAEACEASLRAVWSGTGVRVLAFESTRQHGDAGLPLSMTFTDDDATLAVANGGVTDSAALPADVLIDGEWPWRLAALPFDIAYGSTQPLALVDSDGRIAVVDAFVHVVGGEPGWTPAGNFVAWRVDVTYELDGEEVTQSAWYDIDAPHTLVRYDDGEVSYVLTEVE